MLIELESIFNNEGASVEINRQIDFSDIDLNGTKPFKKPAEVVGKISNNTGIVSVNALAKVIYSGACDRCAGDMELLLETRIDHVLVLELNDEDNDDFLLLESYVLNLDELVTEDVMLNLPLKFLCKEECKGLCPQCGKNLNEGPCECKKEVDPRLEVLRQLLDK